MKINIANPATGQQKLIDIDDERRYRVFYDKKIAQEVPPTPSGPNGRATSSASPAATTSRGFPMKQGVLLPYRVKLLLADGHSGKRKSVRGVVLVKQGEGEIAGLTDNDDDVRKYVVRREVTPKKEGAKPYTKAPKIQRLVTPIRLQRRRHLRSLIRRRTEHQKEQKAEFDALLAKRVAEKKAKVAAIKAAHHK
ncbi:40S ribosomal protein S6 [Mycena olivaceomarginata]|nr:40S ribosomal protein S6 [Mycena olivaceomarginata]